jgi:hypothetical protein
MKPRGLWISVENKGSFGWKAWCLSEDFRVSELTKPHLIILKPEANILMISSVEEFDKFHEQFKEVLSPGLSMYNIKWAEVAKRWDGLIIAPYLWERRLGMELLWYYGWDCASGCIWHGRTIKEIKFMPIEALSISAKLIKRRLLKEKDELLSSISK